MERSYESVFIEFYSALYINDIDTYSFQDSHAHIKWSEHIARIARIHARAVMDSLEEEG